MADEDPAMLPWMRTAMTELERLAPVTHQAGCTALQDAGYATGLRRHPRRVECDCPAPGCMRARVKADRAVTYLHGPNSEGDCPACGFPVPCPTLRALAASYRGIVEGWRDEWSLTP